MPGGRAWLLRLAIPRALWDDWCDSGVVVRNPGYQGTGHMHTEQEGHWIYDRKPMYAEDPSLSLVDLEQAWEAVSD